MPGRPILVAGVLGAVSKGVQDRLRAEFADVTVIQNEGGLLLAADRPLRSWTSADARGWCWGQALSLPAQPNGWQDVAREAGCAGVCVDRAGVVTLHADAAGAIPVFIDQRDDCLLFASSVDLLVRLAARSLHVDRQAWAEILAGGMVMSHRTPFEEIRRLRPHDSWRLSHGRATERRAGDLVSVEELLPGNRETAAELIERMRAVVRRIEGDRLTVPLSGGWDSRFLAAVAADDGRDVVTITASDEFGRDEEPLWAAEVANLLGLPNERVTPPDDWWAAAKVAAQRQEYLTSKSHWLIPLLMPMAAAGGTILDGLGGDALVKMELPAELALATPTEMVSGVRKRFAPPVVPGEMLASALADEIDTRVAERVEECWQEVRHHPAALHLLNYHLRTPTGVGLTPTLLFASAASITLPFLAQMVLDLLLAVSPSEKGDKRWYRDVFAELDHDLGHVPSTNDAMPIRRLHRRVDLAPQVEYQTRLALSDSAVAGAIGPRLRAAVSSGNVLDPRLLPDRRVVRGLVLYSWWARRYQEQLVDWRLAGDEGPGAPVWRGWSGPAPTPLPDAVPDRRWLDAQRLEPAALFVLKDAGPTTDQATGLERRDARTALIAGTPTTFGELSRAIGAAVEALAPGGRVALSLDLSLRPTDTPGLGLMGVCETVVADLDVIHVESSARRLRIIATVADPSGRTPGLPPQLVAAAIRGLESRVESLDQELDAERRRHRELEAARDIAEGKAVDAEAETERQRDTVRALRNSVDRMRTRRVWRLAEAFGAARTSPKGLVRLPWDVLRILARRRVP